MTEPRVFSRWHKLVAIGVISFISFAGLGILGTHKQSIPDAAVSTSKRHDIFLHDSLVVFSFRCSLQGTIFNIKQFITFCSTKI